MLCRRLRDQVEVYCVWRRAGLEVGQWVPAAALQPLRGQWLSELPAAPGPGS
ncbi:MAG: hypothetical protein L0Y54_18230 [Sporichthyaceae bacterium]|nr:hypothetical protein [Sporichthyaceae bacterium]